MTELTYNDICSGFRDYIDYPYLRQLHIEPEIIQAYEAEDDFFIRVKNGRITGIKGDYIVDFDGFLKVISKKRFEKKYCILKEQIASF